MIEQKASVYAIKAVENIAPIESSEKTTVTDSHPLFEDNENNNQPNRLLILSPREQEIVRLVAKGLPNKTIAAILDISPWTVATHLRRIFGKLSVRSRAAMIATLFESVH